MTSERIIFKSDYGVVYGIRENDYFTAYEDGEKEKPVREEVQTVKTAEKPNRALKNAWKKYGK